MKEVNRIVVGLVALRLMKDGETQQYEIFESNKMNKLDKNRMEEDRPNKATPIIL
jgi:hypothetical protein